MWLGVWGNAYKGMEGEMDERKEKRKWESEKERTENIHNVAKAPSPVFDECPVSSLI